jgi:hypothetical protein
VLKPDFFQHIEIETIPLENSVKTADPLNERSKVSWRRVSDRKPVNEMRIDKKGATQVIPQIPTTVAVEAT